MLQLLYNPNPKFVTLNQLQGTELAVIRTWGGPLTARDEYFGRVVQRVGNRLITVGAGAMHEWSCSLFATYGDDRSFSLEVLSKGAVLMVK